MRARAKLLSWGFPKIASPSVSAPHVHSQMVAHPSARRCHPSRVFRPCRSSRLRRFSPCDPLQVCCALQPILRFAPFRILRPFPLPAVASGSPPEPRSSPDAHHTLQSLPLAVRRTASPRPLPSRRLPTSGLSSSDESVVRTRCLHQTRPVALLGFLPLQGSPLSTSWMADSAIRTRCRPGTTIAGAPRVPRFCGLDLLHPWRRPESPQTDTDP